MAMIVLCEPSEQLEPSASARDIKLVTEVAKLLGYIIYYIPPDFERCGTLAIDIGQAESGEWIVIETGDAQFAGLSQIPALLLWNKLKEL